MTTEHDIQNAIIQLITVKGGVAIRVNSGSIVVKDIHGTRVFKGADKGTSDIIALYRKVFMAIEVKRPGRQPTPEQAAFLNQVIESGGIGIVAYSHDDVLDVLEQIDGELIL